MAQRKSRFVREDLIDENGTKVGEMRFDPEDTIAIMGLADTYRKLLEKEKEVEDLTEGIDGEKMERALSKKAETTDDFETAQEVFGILEKARTAAMEMVDDLKSELDKLVGNGVCDFFMDGSYRVELLEPVFEWIQPYIEKKAKELKESEDRKSQYLADDKGGVLK